MRELLFQLGLVCCFCVAVLEPLSAGGQSATLPRIVAEEAFSTSGLHVIGVDSDADHQLRWATWGKHSKHGMSTVLALMKKTRNGVTILWLKEKLDSYEPGLLRLTSWRYGQHPVLALSYRYGALAEQVEFYGLDAKNGPVKVGEGLGEDIEWSVNSKGEGLLNIYSKSGDHMLPTCYRWENKKQQLERVDCK
ncbi:MAG: hypothetical protein HXX11_07360 [Desulfuromonadales bacterium]|nr:hypothetical protein [Desulfuromonadales bacterium]